MRGRGWERWRVGCGVGIGHGRVRVTGGIEKTVQTVISTVFDKHTIVYDRLRPYTEKIRSD